MRGVEPFSVDPSQCPALKRWGQHLYVDIYSRPWRRLWRRQNEMRCWECTLRIIEPGS